MKRPIWIALMLAAIAFAGCTEGGDDDPADLYPDGDEFHEDQDDGGSLPEGDGGGEGDDDQDDEPEPEAEPENTPPSATVSASIETGQVPFNVTFTLDGADSQGDALAWVLDADGDGTTDAQGTQLPAEHIHEFTSEGLFTASFAVSDGKETTTATIEINATAAAAGPVATSQAVSVGWTLSTCYLYMVDSAAGFNLAGLGYGHFAVDAGTIGQPFSIEYTGPDLWLFWGIVFFDDAGTELEAHETVLDAYSFSGVVPDGATQAVVYSCPGATETAEYTAGPA